MTIQETIQAIGALTQSLAYVQDTTVVGKIDENDFASPVVPKYSVKSQMLTGDLRKKAEAKLGELIDKL